MFCMKDKVISDWSDIVGIRLRRRTLRSCDGVFVGTDLVAMRVTVESDLITPSVLDIGSS